MANRPVPTDEIDLRWFIQRSDKIIGPVPGPKVLEFLVTDEINVTHRVSNDRREWRAICNVPYFEEMILSRIRAYSGESLNVGQMKAGGDEDPEFEISQVFGLHGATEGISEQLDHARQLEELTANIQKLNSLRKEIQLSRKTVVYEKEEDTTGVHPEDQNVFIPVQKKKSFDFASLLKGSETSKKRMYALLTVIVLSVGGIEGWSHFQNAKKADEDRQKMQAALAAQAAGDYAKAIGSFRGVDQNRLTEPNFASTQQLLDLADAHIKGRDTKTGQEILERAKTLKNLAPSDLARIHAMQAMIASIEGDSNRATVEFETSLKLAEVHSTLHNLAVLKLRGGKLEEAEALFLKAIETSAGTNGSPSVMGLFETAMAFEARKTPVAEPTEGFAPENPQHARLVKLAELVDSATRTTKWHQAELTLARAVVRFYLGQTDAYQLAAIDLIDSPVKPIPRTASEIDDSLSLWANLYRHCNAIYTQPKANDFTAAFYASCLRRSHGAAAAVPFAKYAVTSRPTDAVYIGLLADLYLELGQKEEAAKVVVQGGHVTSGSKLAARVVQSLGIREPANTVPVSPSESSAAQ